MIDPSFLIVSGIMSLGIGFVLVVTGAIGPINSFGGEPPKDYSFPIGIMLIIVGMVLMVPGMVMQEEQSQIEMNELCESIDMEFLKKSTGGLFGNSYVLCYDKETKQIKEIPL